MLLIFAEFPDKKKTTRRFSDECSELLCSATNVVAGEVNGYGVAMSLQRANSCGLLRATRRIEDSERRYGSRAPIMRAHRLIMKALELGDGDIKLVILNASAPNCYLEKLCREKAIEVIDLRDKEDIYLENFSHLDRG